MADATYIEPLNEYALTEIIKKERPDALLPNLGGQTGLNLSSLLAKKGILEKYNVKVIGVNIDAIERGEDRIAFKETMNRLGIDMPKAKQLILLKMLKKLLKNSDIRLLSDLHIQWEEQVADLYIILKNYGQLPAEAYRQAL